LLKSRAVIGSPAGAGFKNLGLFIDICGFTDLPIGGFLILSIRKGTLGIGISLFKGVLWRLSTRVIGVSSTVFQGVRLNLACILGASGIKACSAQGAILEGRG
jgi:hypothetical protein